MPTCSRCKTGETAKLQRWCRDCKRAYQQTPEYKRKQAARYQRNRERIAAVNRAWAIAHPEAVKAKFERWLLANPARRKQIARAAYRRSYPRFAEYYRERSHSHRARKRGAEVSDLTPSEWRDIRATFNGKCAYCLTADGDTQDHMHPVSRGGPHTRLNVIPACRSCNSTKRDRTLLEWLL